MSKYQPPFYFNGKNCIEVNLITKKEFDQLYYDGEFKEGPFMGESHEYAPYSPYRDVVGILKSDIGVWFNKGLESD